MGNCESAKERESANRINTEARRGHTVLRHPYGDGQNKWGPSCSVRRAPTILFILSILKRISVPPCLRVDSVRPFRVFAPSRAFAVPSVVSGRRLKDTLQFSGSCADAEQERAEQ